MRRIFSSCKLPRGTINRQVVIALAITILAFGVLYFYNLGGWQIHDDEGTFLYQVWRIDEGERPYEDFMTSRWPLFLYTGAGWMRLFGAEVVPMRALPVLLTLGTALLIFLIARQAMPPEAGLLSMVVFLLHPEVFRFGRSFQPESFYVFFSVLGLYLFSRGIKKERKVLLSSAGLVFAVASLYKLLAVLVLAGCILFLVVAWLHTRRPWSKILAQGAALLIPWGLLLGLTVVGAMLEFPHFYAGVVGVNVVQGQDLSLVEVIAKGTAFLLAYSLAYAPFLLLTIPAVLQGWSGHQETSLFSWQVPTALAFAMLSRELFPRLLLYLVPSFSLLFIASIEPIRLRFRRPVLALVVVGSVITPWILSDLQLVGRSEQDTLAVSRYIQSVTLPDANVLSDYQELNFYARRASTYSGAELSYVITAGSSVTGADLVAEIEARGVEVVIVDVSPQTAHHIVSLVDYVDFRAHLQEHFVLLDVLPRGDQQLEIHSRAQGP